MFDCIIFDLDGTLVDSEPLCNKAFLDLLPEIPLTIDGLIDRFRGRKLAEILKEIGHLIGRELPSGFETEYRAQVEENFRTSLAAFPNVLEALQAIDVPICIASSGPKSKIASALEMTFLDSLFLGRTFSSYEVGKWKPDPGLFLHAASQMGVSPKHCLVVEDSPVGVAAAVAAGMTPLQFCHDFPPIDGVESFRAYNKLTEKLCEMSKTASRS